MNSEYTATTVLLQKERQLTTADESQLTISVDMWTRPLTTVHYRFSHSYLK